MRKDRYVVGYSGAGNVVYGKYHTGVVKSDRQPFEDYAQPMTAKQAQRALKELMKDGKVFKLVEVKL